MIMRAMLLALALSASGCYTVQDGLDACTDVYQAKRCECYSREAYRMTTFGDKSEMHAVANFCWKGYHLGQAAEICCKDKK